MLLLFLKSNHFCMCIIQNSWQIFLFSQNLKFFKISPWNLIFSCKSKLSPLCMNEKKWKKCWVVYVCYRIILEQCGLGIYWGIFRLPKNHCVCTVIGHNSTHYLPLKLQKTATLWLFCIQWSNETWEINEASPCKSKTTKDC